MPVVVPAAPNSASSLQTVPTQQVFDYLYDSQDKPLAARQVVITLGTANATSITPQVSLGSFNVTVVTDNNGFWSANLIPNANINPANTTYLVQPPGLDAYSISIPSSGGPFQSTSAAVLVNTPALLQPATTGITGNLTVSGNESITGTLSVTGTATLAGTTTGALTTAAASIGGDLTILSAFRLLFGAVVAKIVGGATSLSLRNHADNADNVLVTDAGAVTVRNGLTVTAGDGVLTAGRLLISSAAAKILGGATSLSLRNTTDSADNVLVADAGAITLRNSLSLPPTAGGSVAATSYGTVPVKLSEFTPSGVASQSVTIPGGYRKIVIDVFGRSTVAAQSADLQVTANADSGTNYSWERGQLAGAAGSWGSAQGNSVAFMTLGFVVGATGPTNGFDHTVIEILNYNQASTDKAFIAHGGHANAYTAGGLFVVDATGYWFPATPAAITSIALAPSAGNWASGSLIVVRGEP